MKLLVAHPGASWSTHDVFMGLTYGLQHHGVEVIPYRLDKRIGYSKNALHVTWRQEKKTHPDLQKPHAQMVLYHAGIGVLEMALRERVDAVLVVSAMLLHPDVVIMMKRAGLRVVVLFTESPYDLDQELRIAAIVDGCWTNERSAVPAFRAVNPNSGYLPHAWHPARHRASAMLHDAKLPAHDVVFVGSAFDERVKWFNAIDWTGIDLGIYGGWSKAGLTRHVKSLVRSAEVSNETAAGLYRRAKIGLNLYRRSMGWGTGAPQITHAESLNPRAYELAACGVFHLSEPRLEVQEIFGTLVPTFTTPFDCAALIRRWVPDDAGRAAVSAQLPACVAESSWIDRSTRIIGDLQTMLTTQAA